MPKLNLLKIIENYKNLKNYKKSENFYHNRFSVNSMNVNR